jgi:ADP-ribosyl-[dinitrogen reductase] hydrolase
MNRHPSGENLSSRSGLMMIRRERGVGIRSARWAVGQGNYEEVVKAAISLGNDTDTTACIAGGIAGLRDGIDGIPSRWLEQLRGGELVEPLIDGLMHRQGLDY